MKNEKKKELSRKLERPENETRVAIIDAAEKLFAGHGLSGVSLRTIVADASANLAAIHYHFGSKEALFEAVYARRARVIADDRLHRLQEIAAAGKTPTVEAVIEAFLVPGIRDDIPRRSGGATFARLRARLMADDSEFGRALQAKYFDESSKAFLVVLATLLPHLPARELHWRFHFMLGAMMYQMAKVNRIEQLSDGKFSAADVNVGLDRLVAFFAYGFKAPVDLGIQLATPLSRRRASGSGTKISTRKRT